MICIQKKKKKPCIAYVSKHNSNCEKKNHPFKILNKKIWYYIAVKRVPALMKEITLKHQGDFYSLNCLYSFAKRNNLNQIKQHVKTKIFLIL